MPLRSSLSLQDAFHTLRTLWLDRITGSESIFCARLLGLAGIAVGADSVYDVTPLENKIRELANPIRIAQSGRRLRIQYTVLETGELVTVTESGKDIVKGILASASIPVFFPPVRLNGQHLVDGGVRQMTPLATAFDAEPPPDIIYVVYAQPTTLAPVSYEDSGTGFGVGAMAYLMRTIAILLNQIDLTDVAVALKINALKRHWETLRPQLPADNEAVHAIDAVLGPKRYAKIVEIRPRRQLSGDGLNFVPSEIRANYEYGREMALMLPAEDTLEDSYRSAVLTAMRRIRVRATLARQSVDTTVDLPVAKYYIERYLQGVRERPDLDRRIDQVNARAGDGVPTRELLREFSHEFSPDFATALLADRLLRDGKSRPFRQLYEHELAKARTGQIADTPPTADQYLFLFVPGWVYESVKELGADLAGPRQLITRRGIQNYLIPIAETGTIDANADHIAEELSRAASTGKRLVVTSASTGGPSTALALAKLGVRERERVKAWVNVGGLLRGSAIADVAVRLPRRLLTLAVCYIKGWEYASVQSMTTKRSRERFAMAAVVREMFCVNYIGIPFSGDVGPPARREYRYLRREGPNDGLTLITDALVPDAATIAVLGADHYHNDPEASLRTTAVTDAVLKYVDGIEGAPSNVVAHHVGSPA